MLPEEARLTLFIGADARVLLNSGSIAATVLQGTTKEERQDGGEVVHGGWRLCFSTGVPRARARS